MKYIVYFEIYGKKMKAKLSAKSEADAKEKIKEKITFHKIERDYEDDSIDFLKKLFNIK